MIDLQSRKRFWAKVQMGEPDECWEWQAASRGNGYGAMKVQGKVVDAHRISYEMRHGGIPEGALILHSCHNRACVNPEHLRAGTSQDNVHDMIAAGTHNGTDFSEDDVRDIRRYYAAGELTQAELGVLFGTSRQAVGYIVRGDVWKHVT